MTLKHRYLIPPTLNSQNKNKTMSQTSFLKLSFLPSQFTSSCTPNRLHPGHRHCLGILDFLLLLLLYEVKKGIGKTGKIETAKTFIFLSIEIFFLINSLQSKENFSGFCSRQHISEEPGAPPLQKSARILIQCFCTLQKKKY